MGGAPWGKSVRGDKHSVGDPTPGVMLGCHPKHLWEYQSPSLAISGYLLLAGHCCDPGQGHPHIIHAAATGVLFHVGSNKEQRTKPKPEQGAAQGSHCCLGAFSRGRALCCHHGGDVSLPRPTGAFASLGWHKQSHPWRRSHPCQGMEGGAAELCHGLSQGTTRQRPQRGG